MFFIDACDSAIERFNVLQVSFEKFGIEKMGARRREYVHLKLRRGGLQLEIMSRQPSLS